MENALNAADDAATAIRPFNRASGLPEECFLARRVRFNLHLVHGGRIVQDVLELFLFGRHELVAVWRPGQRLVLPPVARLSTLILHDVAALPFDDQRRLSDWLERAAGRTQVVSTTRTSLFARVEDGTFLDTLYYRLITVNVDFSHQRFPLPVIES
jgi:DNA-binding NtrC family response regulator